MPAPHTSVMPLPGGSPVFRSRLFHQAGLSPPRPRHAPPLPLCPRAASRPAPRHEGLMCPPRGLHPESLLLDPGGSRHSPDLRTSRCLSLPANSPEAHGDAACCAPPRAPPGRRPLSPSKEHAEEPRNSPGPQKMKRGDGEAQRRQGGTEEAGMSRGAREPGGSTWRNSSRLPNRNQAQCPGAQNLPAAGESGKSRATAAQSPGLRSPGR